MKLSDHIRRSEEVVGVNAEDIHAWIDCFSNTPSNMVFMGMVNVENFDPFNNRKHRHCKEAVYEAVEEFRHKYSKNIIEAVFELHVRDDYEGYFPTSADFNDKLFLDKYHSRWSKSTLVTI